MTRQTEQPLVHHSLNATNREAIGLVNLVHDGDLELNTPYQRGDVWTTDQRIALVKSWLLGLPIPALIFSDRMTWWRNGNDGAFGPAYAVIDGKQRLLAAIAWFGGDFAVPASWFPAEQVETTEESEDGPYVRFGGLTVVGQRRFSRMAQLPVCEARVATVREEAAIYLLVNGAGSAQIDEDMDRASAVAQAKCDRDNCPDPLYRRVLVKSSKGKVMLDMLLCKTHTSQERTMARFGMAEVEVEALPAD